VLSAEDIRPKKGTGFGDFAPSANKQTSGGSKIPKERKMKKVSNVLPQPPIREAKGKQAMRMSKKHTKLKRAS
jgi:hypothetical protein